MTIRVIGLFTLFCLLTSNLVGLASAIAQGSGLTADTSMTDLFKTIVEAARSGNWIVVFSAALLLAVGFGRKYGVALVPFLGTKLGGWLLNFGSAAAAALGTAGLAGRKPDLGLFLNAINIGLSAAGLLELFRDIKDRVVPTPTVVAAPPGGARPPGSVIND